MTHLDPTDSLQKKLDAADLGALTESQRDAIARTLSRWSAERAWEWYNARPWIVGCNFIPSNAINQLEMWQAETFDPETIDRELGFAASIGMNCVRTYLHDLAYEADPKGFLERMDRFLTIASRHGITPMLVFFDDCWKSDGEIGPQPAPKPGVHNSGWLQSPLQRHRGPEDRPRLKTYVQAVLTCFHSDERVLLWDLYNEAGNGNGGDTSGLGGAGECSADLLNLVFDWAREIAPSQPLTSGVWYDSPRLNRICVERSDIITFHNYEPPAHLKGHIFGMKSLGRPVICTEWMARKSGSMVYDCLPIFKTQGVGCISWGLVDGKTNTIHAWNTPYPGGEPALWFHDLFRRDGTPYRYSETALFRAITDEAAADRKAGKPLGWERTNNPIPNPVDALDDETALASS